MADYGLSWTQSTVAMVETSRRQVSAVELLALSAILAVSITTLVDSDGADVSVGESTWPAAFVSAVAAGQVADLDDRLVSELPALPPDTQAAIDGAVAVAAHLPAAKDLFGDFASRWGLDELSMNQFRRIVLADDRAVVDAAFRLRRRARSARVPLRSPIAPSEVAGAAWQLWGRSYAAEHKRRTRRRVGPDVSERTRQAVLGHVTREMDRELYDRLVAVLGEGAST